MTAAGMHAGNQAGVAGQMPFLGITDLDLKKIQRRQFLLDRLASVNR